jgi:hypothetical protein
MYEIFLKTTTNYAMTGREYRSIETIIRRLAVIRIAEAYRERKNRHNRAAMVIQRTWTRYKTSERYECIR